LNVWDKHCAGHTYWACGHEFLNNSNTGIADEYDTNKIIRTQASFGEVVTEGKTHQLP
jgi:hypothetical protein